MYNGKKEGNREANVQEERQRKTQLEDSVDLIMTMFTTTEKW